MQQQMLNSPYGQQLMASAAAEGQGLQSEMAARAAQSGLDPSSGGESGASTFASGAASQAQAGLERGVKSDLWKAAMPIAAQTVQQARDMEIGNNAERNADNPWGKIASAASTAGSFAAPGGGGTRVKKVAGNESAAPTLADQLGFPGVTPKKQ